MFHPLSYLTKVLGLAALGLAGVTIGAFFAQKWQLYGSLHQTESHFLCLSLLFSLSKHLSAPHCPAKPSTSALQRPPLIRRPSSHGSCGAHALSPSLEWRKRKEKEYRMRTRRNALTLWLWCSSLPCTVALARRSTHKTRPHTCSHTSHGCKNTKKKNVLSLKFVSYLRNEYKEIFKLKIVLFWHFDIRFFGVL